MGQIKDQKGWVDYYTENYCDQCRHYNVQCDEEFVREQFNTQYEKNPKHTYKEDGTYIAGYRYDIIPVRP